MIEKHTGFLQCHSPLSPVMLVSVYLCAVFYSLHGVVATLNNKSWLRLCLLQPYESCLPITNKNISAFVLQWRIQDFFTGGEHYSLHVYHSHVVGNFPPLVTQFYEGGAARAPLPRLDTPLSSWLHMSPKMEMVRELLMCLFVLICCFLKGYDRCEIVLRETAKKERIVFLPKHERERCLKTKFRDIP